MNLPACLPRENPFRSAKIEGLAFRGPSLETLFGRWEECGRRGALVGPCGTGKTTLLRAITDRLLDDGVPVESWAFFAGEPQPSAREIAERRDARAPGTVVIIDGAEQLSGWRRRRRFALNDRCVGGVWMTSHREGWLSTVHLHEPDLDTLVELVTELDPELAEVPATRARVSTLLDRHAGNAREVFYALYRTRAGLDAL